MAGTHSFPLGPLHLKEAIPAPKSSDNKPILGFAGERYVLAVAFAAIAETNGCPDCPDNGFGSPQAGPS